MESHVQSAAGAAPETSQGIRRPGITRQLTFPSRNNSGKMGLLTRALLSGKPDADSDLSPYSKRAFMDPVRSHFGLKQTGSSPQLSSPAEEEKSADIGSSSANQMSANMDISLGSAFKKLSIDTDSGKETSQPNPSIPTTQEERKTADLNRGSNITQVHSNKKTSSAPVFKKLSNGTGSIKETSQPNPIGIPAPQEASKTPDLSTTRVIEMPMGPPNLSTDLFRMSVANKQNIDPRSGPILGVAAVISQRQMSKSAPSTHLPTPTADFLGSKGSNNKSAKGTGSGTGPLRSHNLAAGDPGTPASAVRHPNIPLPASASGKTKSAKKPGGSIWKFVNDTVNRKEYLLLKELGKGGCGQVYLVMEKESRQLFAMKKVNLTGLDKGSVQECINEVKMLGDLKDSELVIHIDSWEINQTDNTMKIIMEYGHCDLNNTMDSCRVSLTKLKSVWERLLQIVEKIHSQGIVHADLKPANFVWVAGNLKIIDFGISNRIQTDHTSIPTLNPKGTLNFISPETIRPDASGIVKMSFKSDIWSLGCILYMMVYGKTPFQDITHQVSKMTAIMTGAISYPPLPPQLKSSSLISVLKLCFELDPRLRPTASELLQHPFFFERSYGTL